MLTEIVFFGGAGFGGATTGFVVAGCVAAGAGAGQAVFLAACCALALVTGGDGVFAFRTVEPAGRVEFVDRATGWDAGVAGADDLKCDSASARRCRMRAMSGSESDVSTASVDRAESALPEAGLELP